MNKLECVRKGDKLYSIEIPYSTEEHKIGVWENGKPLYRKVIKGIFANEEGGKGFEVNITSLNVENIFMSGSIQYTDGYGSGIHKLGSYLSNNYYSGIQLNSVKRISVWASKTYHNGEVILVIEYTKTTD